MRKVWIFFVMISLLVIASVAVVGLAGMNIPKKHDISREIELKESPHTIWYLLADYAGYSKWRSDIRFLVSLPPSNADSFPTWREYEMNGHNVSYVMVESEFPQYIAFETVDDGIHPIGRWDINILKSVDGCTVHIREREIGKNPFQRFKNKYLSKRKRKADIISASLLKRYPTNGEMKKETVWG